MRQAVRGREGLGRCHGLASVVTGRDGVKVEILAELRIRSDVWLQWAICLLTLPEDGGSSVFDANGLSWDGVNERVITECTLLLSGVRLY